jgi:protein-S-isoprenylcysteine O-methyltransferase Ste14
MRIPPPLLFLMTFLAGIGLQHLAPLAVHSAGLAKIEHIVGGGLLGLGVLLALSCVLIFFSVRTTLIPFGAASNLVVRGPYRLTRNPMYVSLVLAYVGLVGILTQIWPLILLPLPVAVVNGIVIPFEEARLREIFGQAYEQYCTKVRRWV